jgi:hypothetical protein
MAISCDVIVQWSATPEELTALGAALWRWCSRAAGDTHMYQCLNNQALADLIAGKFPTTSAAERRGVHLRVRDEESLDRRTAVASLRRELPTEGVEDVVVDGTSWDAVEPGDTPAQPCKDHLLRATLVR